MKEDFGFAMGEWGNGFLTRKQNMTFEEQLQSDLFNTNKDCGIEEFDGRRWNQVDYIMTKEEGLKHVLDSQRLVRYSRYLSEGELVVVDIIKPAKED